MKLIRSLGIPAALLALGGCAQSPINTGPLESKIAEAKSGDFGECYSKVHSAAMALEAAEAQLAYIKQWPGQVSQYVADEAVATAEKARADRVAAEEACYVRVAALETEMTEVKSTLQNHEERLLELERVREIVRGVTFVTGSAKLTADAQTVLRAVANRLLRSPIPVEIAGHASSTGTPEMNMKLSQARAESVRRFLISQGVDGSNLTAKGYGINEPIADNNTAAGRRANQRVELRFRE